MGRHSISKERIKNPKKRQQIIDGLIQFFRTNSLANSNMDDIAIALNKSKATLYKYYKSKEAMVDAVIEFKVTKIAGFVLLLHDEELPYLERYNKSFQLLELHISDISNEFINDLRSIFPEIYDKINDLINLAVKELTTYYEEGMKEGFFNPLNAKLLSQNDFIFFRTLTDPDFLAANNISLQQAFKDFYDIRWFGLLPRK